MKFLLKIARGLTWQRNSGILHRSDKLAYLNEFIFSMRFQRYLHLFLSLLLASQLTLASAERHGVGAGLLQSLSSAEALMSIDDATSQSNQDKTHDPAELVHCAHCCHGHAHGAFVLVDSAIFYASAQSSSAFLHYGEHYVAPHLPDELRPPLAS